MVAGYDGDAFMALRATIYKVDLHIADSDQHYYGSHALTIARHPSETDERMMVRLAAFVLNAHEDLSFTKGLSEVDEPDVWRKDLTGAIEQWIDVGKPDERRILKACGRADQVIVCCYGGHGSKVWWDGVRNKLGRAANLQVIYLPVAQVQAMAALVSRTMDLHVTIQDGEAFVSNDKGQVTLEPESWR